MSRFLWFTVYFSSMVVS